ncbi:hypothetical protein H8876_02225, partial [Clostridiales Family XIII bacterium BX16]|nr:hypothetical protein [Lentihominibacter faecis]
LGMIETYGLVPLTVEKDGRIFTGNPGDCLFFQNGAKLTFGSPNKVTVFYATH